MLKRRYKEYLSEDGTIIPRTTWRSEQLSTDEEHIAEQNVNNNEEPTLTVPIIITNQCNSLNSIYIHVPIVSTAFIFSDIDDIYDT